ncbi:hypothetical protein A33M_0682 [Rhodovulum sp. PH10]|uniref:hypothetical protein n=1 Tax=Rhodovulum sp. PH10 TaxID=1187851 RepID=UPI00027C2C97|nr:hypothetical protein [Rhodovulum sp. PH10]EJW09970.1 hypothetical protein A33M_0682 [Rhodovulum sp. PH10]
MPTWVLVFLLITTSQPAFLSPYPDAEACEAARARLATSTGHALRASACVPIGGVPKN